MRHKDVNLTGEYKNHLFLMICVYMRDMFAHVYMKKEQNYNRGFYETILSVPIIFIANIFL